MITYRVLSRVAVASLWLVAATVSAGLVPGSNDVCGPERESAYSAGFVDGQNQGFWEGKQQGFQEGTSAGISQCFNNPASCGITLGSCLAPSQFGETEPNDNIVSADQLVQDVNFLGQSMSPNDEDWFYVVTGAPNQNLTINFSVPRPPGVTDSTSLQSWSLTGWEVSIRDARGNRLAGFNTDFVAVDDPAAGISYRVTLGLIGAYYIVVEPTANNLSYFPYNLAAFIQDSDLDTNQYVVGFFDTEVEPNDQPTAELANRLANGVSMYGIINLRFDQGVFPSGEIYEWVQGENDWYQYATSTDELISLTFCAREPCSAGDWFVEVYDEAGAEAWMSGESAQPLLAFNTEVAITEEDPDPDTFHFGLRPEIQEGSDEQAIYYMRVNHKRLFAAPCAGYGLDQNNDGLADDPLVPCGCDSGYSCPITIANPDPQQLCPDGSGDVDPTADPPELQNQCDVTCRCVAFGGTIELPEGDITSQYNFNWYGTNLPTSTVDTDAYDDYLNRDNPLTP